MHAQQQGAVIGWAGADKFGRALLVSRKACDGQGEGGEVVAVCRGHGRDRQLERGAFAGRRPLELSVECRAIRMQVMQLSTVAARRHCALRVFTQPPASPERERGMIAPACSSRQQ